MMSARSDARGPRAAGRHVSLDQQRWGDFEMMKSLSRLVAGLALAAGLIAAPAHAQDTMEKIKQRGTIVVGVKNDYKPWGYLDPSGKIVGMEIDLVNDIAQKLGVKVEMIPVIA